MEPCQPYPTLCQRCVRCGQVRDLGSALGAPVLDLWTALQRERDWEGLLSDGLHFSEAGQRAVRRMVLGHIILKLPHLRCAPARVGQAGVAAI